MTKKLFLAAASAAVLAFAGAATAGEISGSFGAGVGVTPVPFTATSTYKLASELVVSGTAKATGTLTATLGLDNDIAIPAATQRDHLVAFTVVGADITTPALTAVKTGTGTVTTSLISNNAGVATFLVTVANDVTVTDLTMTAGVSQSAKADITVAATVKAVIGASEIPVDSASATKAAEYKPMLAALTVADTYTQEADLPDYFTLDGDYSDILLAEGFAAKTSGTFYGDLNGDALDLDEVLSGGVVTVKGPLINELVTVAMNGTATATTDLNTAVFTLDATQAAAFAGGTGGDLQINQAADEEDYQAFRAGTYTVTWAPAAATNFTVPSSTTVNAGTITLEGTNFTAPWVSGTGASTSIIRLSNSNSAPSGAVTVRLVNAVKVVGGVATPYASSAVYSAGNVPAGADLQITSSQLVGAFGDFTRGDVQVTINSATDGFTAKMRNTRDGQTFEQSLNHFGY